MKCTLSSLLGAISADFHPEGGDIGKGNKKKWVKCERTGKRGNKTI
jgi:hypothetical protein